MSKSDYIIITIKNNGYGTIKTENCDHEITKNQANCLIVSTKKNKNLIKTNNYNNGDVEYVFN